MARIRTIKGRTDATEAGNPGLQRRMGGPRPLVAAPYLILAQPAREFPRRTRSILSLPGFRAHSLVWWFLTRTARHLRPDAPVRGTGRVFTGFPYSVSAPGRVSFPQWFGAAVVRKRNMCFRSVPSTRPRKECVRDGKDAGDS